MDAKAVQDTLIAIIRGELTPDDPEWEEFSSHIRCVESFNNKGVMTDNYGIFISTDSGDFYLEMLGTYKR